VREARVRVYPPLFPSNMLWQKKKKKKRKKRKAWKKNGCIPRCSPPTPGARGSFSPPPSRRASLGSRSPAMRTHARVHACPPIARRCPARGPHRHSDWVNKTREPQGPGADIIALGNRARPARRLSSGIYKSGAPRRRRRLYRAVISGVRIVCQRGCRVVDFALSLTSRVPLAARRVATATYFREVEEVNRRHA